MSVFISAEVLSIFMVPSVYLFTAKYRLKLELTNGKQKIIIETKRQTILLSFLLIDMPPFKSKWWWNFSSSSKFSSDTRQNNSNKFTIRVLLSEQFSFFFCCREVQFMMSAWCGIIWREKLSSDSSLHNWIFRGKKKRLAAFTHEHFGLHLITFKKLLL